MHACYYLICWVEEHPKEKVPFDTPIFNFSSRDEILFVCWHNIKRLLLSHRMSNGSISLSIDFLWAHVWIQAHKSDYILWIGDLSKDKWFFGVTLGMSLRRNEFKFDSCLCCFGFCGFFLWNTLKLPISTPHSKSYVTQFVQNPRSH